MLKITRLKSAININPIINFAEREKRKGVTRIIQRSKTSETSTVLKSDIDTGKPEHELQDAFRGKENVKSEFLKQAHYRYVYPEFLPDSDMARRHPIREKLERIDMMTRRQKIEIPEFYVGSVMAVTASDPHSPGRCNRFVGICILREEHGLRTYFILRNVVDNQGVEIRYDLYNPLIQKIEILKLEKRLDEHLVYLRDALPEYSTFPFNMEPQGFSESGTIPVNPLKVKMKPQPWYARWERHILHGIDNVMEHVPMEQVVLVPSRGEEATHKYEKYDLMKKYRESIHEEDQSVIWEETHKHHLDVQEIRRRDRKKRLLEKKK